MLERQREGVAKAKAEGRIEAGCRQFSARLPRWSNCGASA